MRSLAVILLQLLSVATMGQLLSNQTLITIPEGVDVYIRGGLKNDGILSNNGRIWVEQDWKNDGNFNPGVGSVIFFGSKDQTIYHTGSFYDLRFTGGGLKNILSSVEVEHEANFDAGLVKLIDDARLWMNEDASATGGNTESYVIGEMYHRGTGYKFFPIGTQADYFPIEYLQVMGYHPVFSVRINPQKFNNSPELITDFYWETVLQEGRLDQSPIRVNFPGMFPYLPLALAEADERTGAIRVIPEVYRSPAPKRYTLESEYPLNGIFFTIAKLPNSSGEQEAYYCSNTLSPDAFLKEDRYIRVFGNMLTGENFYFVVYNRWGLKVYETSSLEDLQGTGWDGRDLKSGQLLPQGSYPYSLMVKLKDGSVLKDKGVITMIR